MYKDLSDSFIEFPVSKKNVVIEPFEEKQKIRQSSMYAAQMRCRFYENTETSKILKNLVSEFEKVKFYTQVKSALSKINMS